jgi:hypothetical protein
MIQMSLPNRMSELLRLPSKDAWLGFRSSLNQPHGDSLSNPKVNRGQLYIVEIKTKGGKSSNKFISHVRLKMSAL